MNEVELFYLGRRKLRRDHNSNLQILKRCSIKEVIGKFHMGPDTRTRTKRLALQKDRFTVSVDKDFSRMSAIQQ